MDLKEMLSNAEQRHIAQLETHRKKKLLNNNDDDPVIEIGERTPVPPKKKETGTER